MPVTMLRALAGAEEPEATHATLRKREVILHFASRPQAVHFSNDEAIRLASGSIVIKGDMAYQLGVSSVLRWPLESSTSLQFT
jgi:hypothetical protein